MMRSGWLLVLLLVMGPCLDGPAADSGSGLPAALQALSRPLVDGGDLAPLLDAVDGARLVLLGESSHGTHEFYLWRDRLSRQLIRECGFSFIAIEGDWSSLSPLDRYVRHHPDAAASAREALLQIERWPRWVWANTGLMALGEWLRAFNRDRAPADRIGIHGMDLYAIWESMAAVERFYRENLPASAAWVGRQYRLLKAFRGDYRAYAEYVRRTGRAAVSVARVAYDLAARYRRAAPGHRDALFDALQHARVVADGERYLGRLAGPSHLSWNTRAMHFARTLGDLLGHYGPVSRGIVWAHNTHIGDARATDMALTGEVNLGQLARERHGRDAVFALGFGTGTGTVLAARAWEGRGQVLPTPPPRRDSLEAALLAAGDGDRVLVLDPASAAAGRLRAILPHRAIGVVFEPRQEPWRNYVPTRLSDRYDAFVFLPNTHALEPLQPP